LIFQAVLGSTAAHIKLYSSHKIDKEPDTKASKKASAIERSACGLDTELLLPLPPEAPEAAEAKLPLVGDPPA